MAGTVQSFPAPTQKVYGGSKKCPRTVIIQIVHAPGNSNVYFSSSKQDLDNAQSIPDPGGGATQILTAGVGIIDFSGNVDQVVLPHVTSDIYVRGATFAAAGVALVAVEAF